MNSERMKQFISLLLAGSMALGLLLPGVSAFAEDGDEQPSSEPSVAQTLVEKITEAAAAAAQNESPPTPETPSQPDTPPQGDPEPLSESPGEPPAPPEGTDPEPDAPGVTEDPAQPEPPREEEPATPAPPEEEKPPEEPTPAEQKEKEQELEEARAHRSDPAADVEIPSEWAAMFEKLDLTGKYPDDLLAVARTQIGYTESEANYAEADGQRRGYTRYGAWNQDPYAPWNLTFVAFCLEYAQVPEDAFPREDDPETWRQTLTEQNLWTTEAPKPGDVAFLPKDPETAIEEETEAALVGIVDEIEEDGTLWVIAGDMENEVRRIELASDQIIGFGVLPPGEERQDPQPTDPAGTDVPADNGEPPADYDTPQAPLDPAESPAVPGTPAGNLAGDLAQRIAEGLARTGGDGQPPNGAAPPGEDGGAPDEPEEKLPDDLTGEDPVELPEDLPEEPEGEPELPAEEELVEELPEELPFLQTQTLDGVTVTVTAEPGVFPEGAVLSVTKVPVAAQITVDAAVAPQRDGGNVALSYTFDVSILDAEGNPIQPADDRTVQVSFSMAQVADANLAPRVYHLAGEGEDLSARPLDVTTDGDTATVTTDGFSFYTVEFTYGDLQYVMEGDTTIPLADILDYVGLTGEVTDVTVSAPELFAAYQDDGVWYVEALEAFQTQEWMKVVIGGVEYEIVVTDVAGIDNSSVLSVNNIVQSASTTAFAKDIPIAPITIKNNWGDVEPTVIINESHFSIVDQSAKTVAYTGPLDRFSEKIIDGSFSFRYPNMAFMADGSEKDVLITFDNIHIFTTQQNASSASSGTWPDIWKVSLAKGKSTYNGLPSLHVASNCGYRVGIQVDITVKIVEHDSETPVEGNYIFTINDINVGRVGQGFKDINKSGYYIQSDTHNPTVAPYSRDAHQANYYYSESSQVLSGRNSDIYIYPESNFNCFIDSNGRFVATRGGPKSYETGYATSAEASGLKTRGWMAGNNQYTVEYYFLPDEITHNITSSSGPGGKIEVWDSGIIGQGNQLQDSNDARTFDVPDGKTVTYKMIPEDGYFVEYVEVDGTLQPVTPIKDENGVIQYYTYSFEDNDKDHIIHVSWETQGVLPATGGAGLPILIKLALGSMVLTTPVNWIKRKWGVGS